MKEKIIELKPVFQYRIILRAFFLFCLFFVCVCCTSEKERVNEESVEGFDIEQSIRNTVRQFAHYEKVPPANEYKPEQTIIMEKQGIRLHLHRPEHYMGGTEKSHYFYCYIITIVNSQDKGYSIPVFPNNIVANYWNFEFQDKDTSLPACHTTFEKEILTAMDYLHLNDTAYTNRKVLCEIMVSLINCERLMRIDKLALSVERRNSADDPKCWDAMQKSFDVILQELTSKPANPESDLFLNSLEDRIYQVNLNRETPGISIKVHKTRCE